MSRRIIAPCILGILGAAASLLNEELYAQPVNVGLTDGVHVRSPFVSVDVFPYGGVSVRAPFTAVDVGVRRYDGGPPRALAERSLEPSALLSPQALAAMDDRSLRRSLQTVSIQLHNRLNRFDTSCTWQQYLRLPDELVENSVADEAAQRAAIATLIQRFNAVVADARYRKIAELSAFAAMQFLLAELDSRLAASTNGNRPEELPPPQPPQSSAEHSVLNDTAK